LQQLAHARLAVLGFLHREHDEVEGAWIHAVGGGGGDAPRQAPRAHLDQAFASLGRHAHRDALGIDELGGGGAAHQRRVVAREGELGAQQRAVRGAEDEDVACHVPAPGICRLTG
jgi:hypothetical protein